METDPQFHRLLNRRRVLQASGLFALMVGLGDRHSLLAATGAARRRSIADLHFADFEAHVGQPFHVYTGAARPLTVHLAAAKQCSSAAARFLHPRHEWFSLAFTSPKGQAFPQGTYAFAHPQLGHFHLFVVPAMSVGHEERHLAIINRI